MAFSAVHVRVHVQCHDASLCCRPQKKLEQIKSQRQKDAKELVTMKHMKDRAVMELADLRKQNKELQEKVAGMEAEMARIRESMSRTSMKLGTPANYSDSTTSISSRGRGTQQPSSSAALAGKSPSLSQVCGFLGLALHTCTMCISHYVSGPEVSNGKATSGRQREKSPA